MSDSFLNIGLRQIRKFASEQNEVHLGDDFFIMEVKYSDRLQLLKYPCRSNSYLAFFCKSGSMDVEVNLRPFPVKPGTLLVGTPGNIFRISNLEIEDNNSFDFIVVAISKEYLSSISFDFEKIFDDSLKILTEPCIELDTRSKAFCSRYLSLIGEILSSDIPNKKEAVGALIASLFYLFGGLMEKRAERTTSETPKANGNTRVKLIFEQFMSLVREHHTSERNMAFYASRLGLTPKYLSKLIKQVSGRSAPDWIDAFVILEAKTMLKYTDESIKEIVYKLHFPNPSVFYKFFKAHTGMTPSEYRNE